MTSNAVPPFTIIKAMSGTGNQRTRTAAMCPIERRLDKAGLHFMCPNRVWIVLVLERMVEVLLV